jgi:hypothetical protein
MYSNSRIEACLLTIAQYRAHLEIRQPRPRRARKVQTGQKKLPESAQDKPIALAVSASEIPPGLDLDLILDNYGMHKHPAIPKRFEKHPRFHFRFTPISSFSLNLIERWLGQLTDKQILRGTSRSVAKLIASTRVRESQQ